MEKKKKIGLIGGISAASTLQYYKTITDLYYERRGDYYYPEILIYSLDFQYFTDMENQGKKEEYIDYIHAAAEALLNAGADFIAMAANSPHSVYDEVKKMSGAEMISIVESAATAAAGAGLKTVLLTGIKYTMQADFYQKGFEKSGINVITPAEAHQDEIDRMIFDELVIHKFTHETKQRFTEIIKSYNADGVILGCTELPLLLKQKDIDIKILDTLSLHCEAILTHALRVAG